MTVLKKIASALDRRDEVPNQQLATEIIEGNNVAAVKELVENLQHKNKNIANDCIKVLYEIGAVNPSLIAPYAKNFLNLLTSKNNRLQWGGMAALNALTTQVPDLIYSNLSSIIDAAESGTVITRDGAMGILTKLCAMKKYSSTAFHLLNEQLKHCAINQLPMYAENVAPVIDKINKAVFIQTISARLDEMEKLSARKRLEKLISKLKANSSSSA